MKIYKLAIDLEKEKKASQESQIKENWAVLFGICTKIVYQSKEEGIIKEFLSLGFWKGDLLLIPIVPPELEIEIEEMDTFPVPEELVKVDLPSDVTVKVPRPVANLLTFLQKKV